MNVGDISGTSRGVSSLTPVLFELDGQTIYPEGVSIVNGELKFMLRMHKEVKFVDQDDTVLGVVKGFKR